MKKETVFDIGFHIGEDTAFYLAKGYHVIAFEANPDLIKQGKIRFQKEISSGHLVIVEGAVCGKRDGPEEAVFFVNSKNSEWGTVSPDFSARNSTAFLADSREIRVPFIPIQDIIEKYGVPKYAKIDVEGVDLEVLSAFGDFTDRPEYTSIESETLDFDALILEMQTLADLGYKSFQVVQQRTIPGRKITTKQLDGTEFDFRFKRSSSGPFAEDLEGNWKSYEETINTHEHLFRTYKRWGPYSRLNKMVGRKPIAALQLIIRRPLPGWFDTHARRAKPNDD